jgi:UDP-glucuronate 4-epimerase
MPTDLCAALPYHGAGQGTDDPPGSRAVGQATFSTDYTMRILLTGAAGFIGAHVGKALLARGDEVIGLDNLNDYYDPQLKSDRLGQLLGQPGFTFEKIDLVDDAGVRKLFERYRPEGVIHLAAQPGVRYSLQNPHAYVQSNLHGFLNVLEGVRHHPVGHFVFASSSSVYGANAAQPYSEHHNVDHPVSLYAASKKANELMAHSYAHLYDIRTTGLRFFTVYGPWGRPDMAPFLFTRAILAGEPIKLFNHGDMLRDFTYIDDIVAGIIGVLDRPSTPDPAWSAEHPDPASSYCAWRVFNIGNNNPVRLMDFVQALEEALGREAQKVFLPLQPGDMVSTCADSSELEKATGFRPATDIRSGVARFVAWYRDYYQV